MEESVALNQPGDLARFQGTWQFGRAYELMLERGSHAPGSVDRVLVERMVKLCPPTSGYLYRDYTPTKVSYRHGSRPELELYVEQALAGRRDSEERLAGIVEFCRGLGERAADDLDAMLLGGTEEEIVQRGSDWCTDVARVACVMCQVAGLPNRIVSLFNTAQAYSGHSIVEVLRADAWGAADPVSGVVYRRPDRSPATTWQLMGDHREIQLAWKDTPSFYADPGQFAGAALSNYLVSDSSSYDYAVSGINDYGRTILEMSNRDWPGGLPWLHGEVPG
jgi:hypothetical protein